MKEITEEKLHNELLELQQVNSSLKENYDKTINEYKLTVSHLQAKMMNFEAVFESSPVAMMIIDETTNIEMVNLAAIKLCGGSESDILQHRPGNALRCVHSIKDPRGCGYAKDCKTCDVRNGVENLIAKGGSISGAELEFFLTRNGEPRKIWMNVGVEPLMMEGRKYWCIALDDINERKLAEKKVRESELKYRSLIESSSDAIFCVDEKGQYQFVNNLFTSTFGKTPEYFIGKTFWDVYDKGQADIRYEATKRLFKTGKSESIEVEVSLPDKTLYFWATTNPIKDETGKVILNLTHAADITELKMIKIQNEEKDKLAAEIINANKELEMFSYSVSHDLRAPLRHINGYVDLLLNRFYDSLPDKARHYLDSIANSSRQMSTLIDELLQFSRIGRQEKRLTDFDMNIVVNEVLAPLKQDNHQRNIEWRIATLPHVYADKAMFSLVWTNLLSNAVKFTRTREKAIIEIKVLDENDVSIFSVHDNGVGFDMQFSQKLFGVFQRLHSTAEFEGTGIGLANVQHIISRHGGRTWAEAEPDKGATFYFSLPKNKEN